MSAPPQTSLLTCRDLTAGYRSNEVLRGIDLEVRGGEWLGIIGPNGAGKSTLLRALAGLMNHGGTITLTNGRPPTSMDIALVPQSPIMPEGMSVSEYVLLGRTAHLSWLAHESRRDRCIVTSVLHRLDLDSFAGRLVSDLSGGETQRVVVARALAQETPILLLDEPTAALDLGHQAKVLELVDDLRNEDGLTVIAAMHDLTSAARFADRIAILDEGTIVSEGPPRTVLDPGVLSRIYATSLTVQEFDGQLVVLSSPPTPRHDDEGTP